MSIQVFIWLSCAIYAGSYIFVNNLTPIPDRARLKRSSLGITLMSYSRTHKPSESEKRLSNLKQQLYGKDLNLGPQPKTAKSETTYSYNKNLSPKATGDISLDTDISFLRADLLKILTLATFGIGIQILIFFSLRSNLIRLPF